MPIPKIVRILLDDAKLQEKKREAKRLSNRKSATTSRARKRKVGFLHVQDFILFHSCHSYSHYATISFIMPQLIEELSNDHARLRRQAIILSYLPGILLS